MPKLEYTVDAVNERLKIAGFRVRVERRRNSLVLVATLPPKPGSTKQLPHQQRIALGLSFGETGLKRAEEEAKRLGVSLALKEFDWSIYIDSDSAKDRNSIKAIVAKFKNHYMATHSLSEATWERHWAMLFRRLPQDSPLNIEMLLKVVHETPRNSRNRLHTCKNLQKLADFTGVKVNLLQYQGNYGNAQVKREIPSDEEVAEWRNLIRSQEWRWVYGMMATYGLRDHECFFCEFTDDGLQVTKGKTGSRLVFAPLYPEWVDEWDLKNVSRPKLDLTKELGYYGDRTSKAFVRYEMPITPYALRHAYAIRASVTFGLPVTTAAALLGHSPDLHYRTYVRHINQKQNIDAALRLIGRDDRPKPPVALLHQSLTGSDTLPS